uniref:Uncharacterized protein n=1 Tax=Anguilla anguilla TaxID=7936 RepID=A0A0E9PSX6_ANGAN
MNLFTSCSTTFLLRSLLRNTKRHIKQPGIMEQRASESFSKLWIKWNRKAWGRLKMS